MFPVYVYGAENTLLVFRNDGVDFRDVVKGFTDELSEDFDIKEIIIKKGMDESTITDKIKSVRPNIVVLMDNLSIKLFKKYQNTLPDDAKIIPSVSLMGVLIDESIKDLKNATGILYEIPIVTSAVNLRSLLNTPIKKFGVLHRGYLENYIEKNKKFCKNEGVDIYTFKLTGKNKNYSKSLKTGLKKLLKEDQVEALWIPNDNYILRPGYIKSIWIPAIRKYKIPVIVGVEVLVQPKFHFGSYAVIPDNVSLGGQAAEIVFDIMNNNWQVTPGTEQPLSVYHIVNLKQIQMKYKISPEKLLAIDKVIK